MGDLLRALHLEDPLPQKLQDNAKQIGDVEKHLSSSQVKALKLKSTAKGVAENLNDLDGTMEPALLKHKKDEFDSLARRIAERDPQDAGLKTDAMELHMLRAEGDCALKNNDSNRKKLDDARTRFGEALVERVDTGGDLAKDLKQYLDDQLAKGNGNRVTAALKALDALKVHPTPRIAQASTAVATTFAQEVLAKAKAEGPSKAEREAKRTPNDVLVHLMTLVSTGLKAHKDDAKLKQFAAEGRTLFMAHTVDIRGVLALVDKVRKRLAVLKDVDLAGRCAKLESQLPDPGDPDALPLQDTQLHDNVYGRVFDTKMVSELVKKPPKELLAASAKSGAAFANMLADAPENEDAAMYFVKNYVIGDQRPWSASVPGFATLATAKNGKDALQKLKTFLSTAPTTGHEIIAFSYALAKMPQAQKNEGHEPDFLTKASSNYSRIMGQANRERGASDGTKVMSTGAGITMLHQPDASGDDNLVPSERPGTANRMGNRKQLTDDQELGDVKRSKQHKIQLDQALPFASGVSGTTNILLHLFEELQAKAPKGLGVTPQEFLMNSMMFLVYDGGHSMHEAMWTANQIQADLAAMDFGLNDPSQAKNAPNDFVSDYDRLIDQFQGPLKQAMAEAQDAAWQGTQEYLEKNSYFA